MSPAVIASAATLVVQAAAVALLAARSSVAVAGAAGVLALTFLLLVHRPPGWPRLVPGAVLATAAAVIGSFIDGPRWLALAAPLVVVALYAATIVNPTFSARRRQNRESAPGAR
jgi:hypothetical protein